MTTRRAKVDRGHIRFGIVAATSLLLSACGGDSSGGFAGFGAIVPPGTIAGGSGGANDGGSTGGVVPPATPYPVTISEAKAKCGALTGVAFGSATVQLATFVAAVTDPALSARPEHCKVEAYKTDKPTFKMLALLPTQWIGSLLQEGGGGLNGRISPEASVWNATSPLQKGLVYLNSNAGNSDPSGRALLDPETLRDYSYQHIGTTYEFGQKLIASYYAIAPKDNYFMGCSRGGGEAMAAAAIYPNNYDGILAQAPAPEMKAFIARSASQSNLAPVTTQEWDSIYGAYIASCDALDGLVDGVVSSKKACTFDPIQWVSDQNWSLDKQATVKSQYSDLKLADGTLINNKYPLGQYLDLTSLGTAWLRIAKNDWNYDPKTFNLEADWQSIVAMADSVSLDVDPAKLSQFLQKGKKIMVFMGGDDAALSIDATNAYVQKVASAAGASAENMQTRYFPGVGHCGSTLDAGLQNGPNWSDMLDSLRKWTEDGVVPSQMIATRLNSDGTVKFTRPLCQAGFYPRYSGSGDSNLAQNFSCVAEGT